MFLPARSRTVNPCFALAVTTPGWKSAVEMDRLGRPQICGRWQSQVALLKRRGGLWTPGTRFGRFARRG